MIINNMTIYSDLYSYITKVFCEHEHEPLSMELDQKIKEDAEQFLIEYFNVNYGIQDGSFEVKLMYSVDNENRIWEISIGLTTEDIEVEKIISLS